jgi:glycosyltransferase involved in cell wall biosynthesis
MGDGPMIDAVEERARTLGIQKRLHLAGLVSPASQGLSACDVVLLTSSAEGTPNVLLEAQWLGIPVVTTEAGGGAAEAVCDGVTGLVVRLDTPEQIAESVCAILRNPNFRAMTRQRGASFVERTFGMHRMVRETLDLYGRAQELQF